MAICAAERRCCATMDVGTAYLNADMVKTVHMRIEYQPYLQEVKDK